MKKLHSDMFYLRRILIVVSVALTVFLGIEILCLGDSFRQVASITFFQGGRELAGSNCLMWLGEGVYLMPFKFAWLWPAIMAFVAWLFMPNARRYETYYISNLKVRPDRDNVMVALVAMAVGAAAGTVAALFDSGFPFEMVYDPRGNAYPTAFVVSGPLFWGFITSSIPFVFAKFAERGSGDLESEIERGYAARILRVCFLHAFCLIPGCFRGPLGAVGMLAGAVLSYLVIQTVTVLWRLSFPPQFVKEDPPAKS